VDLICVSVSVGPYRGMCKFSLSFVFQHWLDPAKAVIKQVKGK